MKNKFNAFKIISASLLSFDLLYVLFFIIWGVLVLLKLSIFYTFHTILIVIFMVLNIAYVVYIVISLILNKKTNDKKS